MSNTYKVHPEVEQTYIDFKANWESGNLENYKFGIIYVANSMKDSYSKAYPDYSNYLMTLNALVLKNDMDYYMEWEVGLMGVVMTKKPKDIRDYLNFSKLLIIDSILVQTQSITWKANSTDYVIGNDPKTQKLFINFNNEIDLMCFNKMGQTIDTFYIEKTKGICYPTELIWEGDHGRVSWKQAKLDGSKVFARFDEYKLDMRQSKFIIENALFTNEFLNIFKIPGNLQVSLSQIENHNNRPVFKSKEKLFIKEIFPDVDFNGYFTMKGNKFIGTGLKNDKASVFIRDKGKNIATLRSKKFEIEPNVSISSNSTKTSFYTNDHNDSIWQNNLNIKYVAKIDTFMYKPKWFKFNTENSDYLIMSRSSKGMSTTPFQDTYHQINIYGDEVIWAKGDSLLYFVTTKGSQLDYTMFESMDFFNEKDYAYFSGQNTDHLNHLAEIKNLYDEVAKNGQDLTPITYQKHIELEYNRNLSIEAIKTLFQQLSYAGFIYYDRDLDYAVPQEKLYRYLSNAGRAKLKKKEVLINRDSIYPLQDYDKMLIISQRGTDDIKSTNVGVNATVNLVNNNMKIDYVEPFRLSPNVKIYTDQIVMKKNRNMEFGGQVGAGLMKLTGTKFKFKYDDYKINLEDENTSMEMWTVDTMQNGKIKYIPITTGMENIQGTVFVNESDNKSNTTESEGFPRLKTEQKARIYYEDFANKFWQGDKDSLNTENFNKKFYFEADNFDMDSLKYVSDSLLSFKGMMHTDLFAPLIVTLTVKTNPKDGTQSLGFTECTEDNKTLENGLAFKGGNFFGCFTLNDKGLFGNGYIDYESSYVHSENFAFMPNEVLGSIDTFSINPNNQSINSKIAEDIPYVIGKNTYFDWKDIMTFEKDKNFAHPKMILYSDKLETPGNLNGTLFYTKNKVSGSGIFEFEDANIIDSNFVFKNSSFSAKACDFDLKVGNNTAFKTTNLNGNVDITEKMGSFYSNDDTARIVFPENYYVCIMDHFLWKIGEGIVNIGGVMPGKDSTNYVNSIEKKIEGKKKNKDIKLYGTILVAAADTLSFIASSTTYMLEDKKIIAENVAKIKIADAMIYPKGTVTINKGGKIDTLKNITFEYPYKIFANEKKGDYIHSFENANVLISNRFNYTAVHPKYYYKYKMQPIVFDKIIVREGPKYLPNKIQKNFNSFDLNSFGTKNIQYGDNMKLSDDFNYEGQGKIKIFADKKFLEFEGYAAMDTTCNEEKAPIYIFKVGPVVVNPDTVQFSMPTQIKSRSKTLSNGLYWETTRVNSKTTYGIKRSFLDGVDAGSEAIFEPSGIIYYNSKAGEYRIGDSAKVYSMNPDTIQGNLMSYSKNLCIMKAQGEFDLFQNWDVKGNKEVEHIGSDFKGYYRCDLENEKHKFQGAWAIDFIAPDPIMNDLAQKILLGTENPPLLDERERMTKNYYAFLGKQATDNIFYQIDNFSDYEMPKELKDHTIMFSDINLIWSQDSSSLVSTGQIGIASINGNKVDRYVNGYVKYRNTKKVRMLIIILEPIPGVLYAFRYRYAESRGVMKFYTKTNNQAIDNYFDDLKDKDKRFKNNYQIEQTTEPEFKSFAKEYINK